jgi:phosphohistidine phosphatase
MMTLYLLRHGIAEDYSPEGDTGRRLTLQGTFQVAMIAKGLHKLGVHFDRIIASPLVRAQETAEIIGRITEFHGTIERDIRLQPEERFEIVSAMIAECSDISSILFVGHQPAMGRIVGGLCAGGELDIDVPPAALRVVSVHSLRPHARGTLLWSLSPSVVEALTG